MSDKSGKMSEGDSVGKRDDAMGNSSSEEEMISNIKVAMDVDSSSNSKTDATMPTDDSNKPFKYFCEKTKDDTPSCFMELAVKVYNTQDAELMKETMDTMIKCLKAFRESSSKYSSASSLM